jgi:tyrosine phenol-lyase
LDNFRTIIEPFRIKAVEAIPMLNRQQRVEALERAGHNLFKLTAEEVTIDLLTDSGTGAMSARQWGALMEGDESYAGSRSFFRFEKTVHDLTGYKHIFPVHQGRAAERIMARTILKPGQISVNNTHFDTTRANIEQSGSIALDLPVASASQTREPIRFKGNMDIDALQATIKEKREQIAMVALTLTNNAVGGQPVSMANIEAVSKICKEAGLPFFLDAARYAENAWFIHTYEAGYDSWTLQDIAQKMFSLADGCWISAKKDGIVHIGGVLATNRDDWAELFRCELILSEGYPTYGGLAGRDLEAMAVGLVESLDPDYLKYRVRSVAYFADGLEKAGIPVVQPAGGHAVFADAGRFLSHIPAEAFPGQALATAFYLEGGIRGVEVGSFMFPQAKLQLLRLALPRRVYTQSHVDYVIEVAERIVARASSIRGYRIVKEPPFLRHFTATLAEI